MSKVKTTEKIGAYSLISTSTETVFISESPAKHIQNYEPDTSKNRVVDSLSKVAKTLKTTTRKKR